MSRIDLPPAWTALGILAAWLVSRLEPVRLGFGPWHAAMGWLAVIAGIGLMVWAAATMLRARTQVMPRREAAALVTGGPFRFSRNPIYLGDLVLLAGMALVFDAPLALVLVPVLGRLLVRRFIRGEEAMLRARFGPAFDGWAGRVRRWL